MVNRSIFLSLLLIGCASRPQVKTYESELKTLQEQCDQASAQYDLQIYLLEQDLKAKNERLSKFNQIDGQGHLRDNTWKGHVDKPIKGFQDWMK